MGQKVNPIGLRLGVNRGWDSIWFAKKKEFGKYLIEDFKIRQYIKKSITNSGVSEIIIERSSKKCTVSIHTSRPGFVIGKKGSDIEKIKKNISKITNNEVAVNIKEWQLVQKGQMSAGEVRRDFIHSHGVVLQALGQAGNILLKNKRAGLKNQLKPLASIDWNRSNAKIWEGRAMTGGRVSKGGQNVLLTATVIKKKLKLRLSNEEQQAERAIKLASK